MNTLSRIFNIARYEWRRALARRMVLVVFILTLVIEVLPVAVLTLLPGALIRIGKLINYIWLLAALIPQGFFIHFLALLISAGSMADEYQNATADVILSKPVKRLEYFIGKFLGGFSLLAAIGALLVFLGVVTSTATFGQQPQGQQLQIENAPLILAGIIASSLIFFAIGFMSGELLRSTTLSYLAASSAFIVILIIENVLEAVAQFQPNPDFYYLLGRILPTWAAVNLPFLQAEQLFPTILATRIGRVIFETAPGGSINEALLYIAGYAALGFIIALFRFLYTDITKRGS